VLGVTVGVGVGVGKGADVGEIARFAVLTLAIALGLPVTVGVGPMECIEICEYAMLYDKHMPTASTANTAITKSTVYQILLGDSDG
jgi:hypothetical protein